MYPGDNFPSVVDLQFLMVRIYQQEDSCMVEKRRFVFPTRLPPRENDSQMLGKCSIWVQGTDFASIYEPPRPLAASVENVLENDQRQ